MSDYTLYCLAQSGNSYKVALMLEIAGVKWTPRFVDMFNGEARGAAFREVNVMGEVPVLECGDLRLTQSGVILDYLAEKLGKYGATNDAERREIWRWILFDNHKFTSYMATYRFMKNFAPTPADPAVLAMLRMRAEAAWKVLDSHLAGREWVVGDRMTIADFSLCGYVYFPDEIGVDWNDYPNLRDWSQRIKAMPGWKHPYDLMPGHPIPRKAAAP
ncbi:MAG: glutathione S-transferase family protein [Rhodocyclaceae bacterium]|nr:glutathione S-transferase family protein [Rhodocyclaceae bacterium]